MEMNLTMIMAQENKGLSKPFIIMAVFILLNNDFIWQFLL